MQIRRILFIGAILAATMVLMPGNGFAQRAAQSQQRADDEDAAALTPGDRLGRGRDDAAGVSEDDGAAEGGGAANVQVVAAADERTNTVVVRGPAELLDLVADVLEALDKTTAKVAGVKVFQLRYADAMNVADVINNLFNEEQRSSRSDDRGGPMFFRGPFGRGGQDSQQEAGSTMAQVFAAADSRTNTVVVTGPDSVLEVIEGVIKSLDTPLPSVADVKVFHLEYADAVDTAELINEVFGQQSSTSSRSSRSGQQGQQVMFMRGGSRGQEQGSQSGSTLSDVAVIASADSRTNSVVVSGAPETLVIITQIIKELDENPEQERRIFVYALKNASATNLMTILNNLFTEMQALTQQGTGSTTQQFQGAQRGAPGAASAGATSSSDSSDLSEETYFEADPNTNSLLCMTSSKNYDKIKPIIEELDKPVGQVLIKILFAELTHSDSVDWGTEFSMLNLRSGGGSTESTQVFGRPPTLTTPGGVAGSTGLSVRTIEGELDVTLHALQEIGRLNVLSRPYILTRNNQLATITVAEEVPIPTGSTTVAGQTQTTIDYRDDIGIVLNVTPSINPEGVVNMVVSPQITTRTGDAVTVSETLQAETFVTRSAETRVAVRDGQTIVIGGLIEDQLTDTIKKVPLLGDVPVLGELFKRTVKSKKKTELLIFLTPHVAQEPQALTSISDAERERSNLGRDEDTADIFQRHMEGMQGGTD